MSLDRDTVRAVLDLFAVEGSDFYHNEPNNYGVIDLKLFTGKGDPERFRGDEIRAKYWDPKAQGFVKRGSGTYQLNSKAVDRVIKLIEQRKK